MTRGKRLNRVEEMFFQTVGWRDCLLWTGNVTPSGYPALGATAMHRWAYTAVYGPIETGMSLDHVCHTEDLECVGGVLCPHRRCVNPEHLEQVTPWENRKRALDRLTPWYLEDQEGLPEIYGEPVPKAETQAPTWGHLVLPA